MKPSGTGAQKITLARSARAEAWLLVAVTVACLVPFVDKPFHIDDPMYLWSARQIHVDPFDFYGSAVNWHGFEQTMADANHNPPLFAFLLAVIAFAVGWSEEAIHAGLWIPAVASVLGTWRLARGLCARPLLAAFATLFSPAVLVSFTTTMADATLLALFVWSVVLWREGLDLRSSRRLFAAASLAALAAMTKYSGLALIPLLGAFAWLHPQRGRVWLGALAIPLLSVLAYQVYVSDRYGLDLIASSGLYSFDSRGRVGTGELQRWGVPMLFLGGSFLPAFLFAPMLWRPKALLAGGLTSGLLAAVLWNARGFARLRVGESMGDSLLLGLHLFAFTASALCVLGLVAADARRSRSPDSALLALWVLGMVTFAGFVNWSINVRSLLPAAPAMGILIARGLERRDLLARGRLAWPLLAAATIALSLAWGDTRHARTVRQFAPDLARRYAAPGRPLWYQGAWGFHYYLQETGGRKLDAADSLLRTGDWMAVPMNNTNQWFPPPEAASLQDTITRRTGAPVAIQNLALGAGFYSDRYGPMPWLLAVEPVEEIRVYRIEQDVQVRGVTRR